MKVRLLVSLFGAPGPRPDEKSVCIVPLAPRFRACFYLDQGWVHRPAMRQDRESHLGAGVRYPDV